MNKKLLCDTGAKLRNTPYKLQYTRVQRLPQVHIQAEDADVAQTVRVLETNAERQRGLSHAIEHETA